MQSVLLMAFSEKKIHQKGKRKRKRKETKKKKSYCSEVPVNFLFRKENF